MALTTEEVGLCNQALGSFGAKQFTFGDITSKQSVQCLLHYDQTRDALLQSHFWRFANGRSALTKINAPPFEWDNQFDLPNDFLVLRSIYDNTLVDNARSSFAIEGQAILTNDSTMEIRYVKKVTDTTKFSPLFTEVLILQLELKLVGPLAGMGSTGRGIKDDIRKTLKPFMKQVRANNRQEIDGKGRADNFPWNDIRATKGGRIDSRLGSA